MRSVQTLLNPSQSSSGTALLIPLSPDVITLQGSHRNILQVEEGESQRVRYGGEGEGEGRRGNRGGGEVSEQCLRECACRPTEGSQKATVHVHST
jgi:hypothetical protein